jgi:L-rhamnonate dehydratase
LIFNYYGVQIRAYVVEASEGEEDQGADCHDVEDEHWINGYPTPIANPMSGYPQYVIKYARMMIS